LVQLLREEEIKFYARAKTKDLLEGDDNTQYFHLVASGKHRKQRIFKLDQKDGVIVGDAELKSYITNYYTRVYLDHQRRIILIWWKIKIKMYHRWLRRKIISSPHLLQRLKLRRRYFK
jgi:hypothetical protein